MTDETYWKAHKKVPAYEKMVHAILKQVEAEMHIHVEVVDAHAPAGSNGARWTLSPPSMLVLDELRAQIVKLGPPGMTAHPTMTHVHTPGHLGGVSTARTVVIHVAFMPDHMRTSCTCCLLFFFYVALCVGLVLALLQLVRMGGTDPGAPPHHHHHHNPIPPSATPGAPSTDVSPPICTDFNCR